MDNYQFSFRVPQSSVRGRNVQQQVLFILYNYLLYIVCYFSYHLPYIQMVRFEIVKWLFHRKHPQSNLPKVKLLSVLAKMQSLLFLLAKEVSLLYIEQIKIRSQNVKSRNRVLMLSSYVGPFEGQSIPLIFHEIYKTYNTQRIEAASIVWSSKNTYTNTYISTNR